MPKRVDLSKRERGTTLLEMVITVAVFSVVMLVVYNAVLLTVESVGTTSTVLGLESHGRKALQSMVQELRMAGLVDHPSYPDDDTYAYPYVWTYNTPAGPYQTPYTLGADELPYDNVDTDDPSDPATGTSNGIVFVLPITDDTTIDDDNGDPMPLHWSGGELVPKWGARIMPSHPDSEHGLPTDGIEDGEVAYLIIRDPMGDDYNILQRRESETGETQELCRYVERVTFSYYLSGAVPQMSQIEIRLYLRKRDEQGRWMKADVSTVVSMRSIKTQ